MDITPEDQRASDDLPDRQLPRFREVVDRRTTDAHVLTRLTDGHRKGLVWDGALQIALSCPEQLKLKIWGMSGPV